MMQTDAVPAQLFCLTMLLSYFRLRNPDKLMHKVASILFVYCRTSLVIKISWIVENVVC